MKRIEFEDDLVVVYDWDDNIIYKGMEDYEPNKYEDWIWNEFEKAYFWKGLKKVCLV